jgi:hypothetical protein
MTDALVPIHVAVPRQAMSLSAAYRQAAIDASALPAGVHFSHELVEDQGKVSSVVIRVRDAYGAIVWEQPYDGRGKRLTVAGGIRF